MQIALSNTLSRTLVKEQTGVGMGLFSMLNFISGAVATSLIGKALDNQTATMKLNPLANPAASVYSNIFLLLAILIIGVWMLYRLQFHASKTLVHTDEPSK
ncbi:hypothetical protein BP422_09075 [Brevibacillus formosus]|uniref:Major facilitator superfamily (MFS) profile domain-containing protein n=1 Tax=Brevibacillus formosus TaxID=54913 RepID=A0A220MFC2_9BACL|nr:hypothetical protein BP422_09075 [Brevibacillus formosus]